MALMPYNSARLPKRVIPDLEPLNLHRKFLEALDRDLEPPKNSFIPWFLGPRSRLSKSPTSRG